MVCKTIKWEWSLGPKEDVKKAFFSHLWADQNLTLKFVSKIAKNLIFFIFQMNDERTRHVQKVMKMLWICDVPIPLEIDLSYDFGEIAQFGSVWVRNMSFCDIPTKSLCISYSNWLGPEIIELVRYFPKTFSKKI